MEMDHLVQENKEDYWVLDLSQAHHQVLAQLQEEDQVVDQLAQHLTQEFHQVLAQMQEELVAQTRANTATSDRLLSFINDKTGQHGREVDGLKAEMKEPWNLAIQSQDNHQPACSCN